MKTQIKACDVISAIVTARFKNAAHKANATRKLDAYVKQQVESGRTEVGTRAAIKAHVTRRLEKAKSGSVTIIADEQHFLPFKEARAFAHSGCSQFIVWEHNE